MALLSPVTTVHPVAEKLLKIEAELNANYFERKDAIRGMLLAILSKEHVFLFGPPGTSKSKLIRALQGQIDNSRYFEVALSKTRPAEAVLGPLDIVNFREHGEYKLKRTGFATACEYVFLDEIGKMSPVLGHDILALANERIYHEVNGTRSVHPAPLWTLFSASNEHPVSESDDAAALWDRLVIRVVVDEIQDQRNFAKLLKTEIQDPTTRIDHADIVQAYEQELPKIGISSDAMNGIFGLRTKLREAKIFPSGRRWKQSIKVLKAAAFLDGATDVGEEHLDALRFVLWDSVDQIDTIAEMCQAAANPFAEELTKIKKGLKEVIKGMEDRKDADTTARATYGQEAYRKITDARKQLDDLMKGANGRAIPGLAEVADLHHEALLDSLVKMQGFDPEVSETVALKQLGLGGGSQVTIS